MSNLLTKYLVKSSNGSKKWFRVRVLEILCYMVSNFMEIFWNSNIEQNAEG